MPLGNCADITRSLSDKLDRPLALRERIRVKAHLLACGGCRAYASQLDVLRSLARIAAGHAAPSARPADHS